MGQSPNSPKEPVTLEQLLRLKRAERPEAEFWTDWEQELRRRQLASLVKTRSWHERLFDSGFRRLRRIAPVGAAAAALGIAWVSFDFGVAPALEAPLAVNYASEAPAPELMVAAAAVVEAPKAEMVRVAAPERRPEVEPLYVMEVLAKLEQPQRFVTVSAPKTLVADPAETGVYVVNSLFSGSGYSAQLARF
jgi:hypothetical protein